MYYIIPTTNLTVLTMSIIWSNIYIYDHHMKKKNYEMHKYHICIF